MLDSIGIQRHAVGQPFSHVVSMILRLRLYVHGRDLIYAGSEGLFEGFGETVLETLMRQILSNLDGAWVGGSEGHPLAIVVRPVYCCWLR